MESSTPRDVKILHLILASMNVTSYQDHVPLQLMDFAHRYTVGVLSDAVAYNDYANASGAHAPAGVGASAAPLSVEDIRLAVSYRVQSQFKPAAPKEVLLELAQERNKRPLPSVPAGYGLRLPPEKYCLTGADRDLDEEDDILLRGTVALDEDDILADAPADEGANGHAAGADAAADASADAAADATADADADAGTADGQVKTEAAEGTADASDAAADADAAGAEAADAEADAGDDAMDTT